MDEPPVNSVCGVCKRNLSLPCEANCGHWFCCFCIYHVWLLVDSLQPCRCPVCGRQINLLVPTEASLSWFLMTGDDADTLWNIQKYNRQNGGSRNGLIQRMRDLPFLVRRFLLDMNRDPQRLLPLATWTRFYLPMIVCVLYVISPLDLVPEGLLPILGLVDDMILILLCVLYVAEVYRAALVARHQG